MSGKYSLPFVVEHPEHCLGLIAVAPVGIPNYIDKLQHASVPVLAVWGSNDHIVSPRQADLLCEQMQNCRQKIIADAGHACYMNETEIFHQTLLAFVQDQS